MRPCLLPPFLWFLAALGLACGGADRPDPRAEAPPPCQIQVQLACQPSESYRMAALRVDALEASDGEAWRVLGEPRRALELPAAPREDEAFGKGLHAQREALRRFRLRLAPGPVHTVTLADGSVHAMALASPFLQGLVVRSEVPSSRIGQAQAFVLLLDLERSIQKLPGRDGKGLFRLWPVFRAVDRLQCGTISGRLLDREGAPLAGARVTAQRPGTDPTLVRAAFTGPDGTYTLDLLPLPGTYHGVAAPRSGGVAYGLQASGPLSLDFKGRARTFDARLEPGTAAQPLRLRISAPPRDGRAELVEVRREVNGQPFLLRAALAVPAEDGLGSVCELEELPEGPCLTRHVPLSADAAGEVRKEPSGALQRCVPDAGAPSAGVL